jgi:hypothetical protein
MEAEMGVLLVIAVPVAALFGWAILSDWRRRRRRAVIANDDVKAQLRARSESESRRYHPRGDGGHAGG